MSKSGSLGRDVLLKRFGRLLLTVFAVSVLTFSLTTLLPGDPVVSILGPEGMTPEAVAQVRSDLRLDDPLPVRYIEWAGAVVTGDLGESYSLERPVSDLIVARLPVTLELIAVAMFFSLLLSVPIGIYTAYRSENVGSKAMSLLTSVLLSVPPFVVGIILILVFAITLDVLPPSGWVPFTESPFENLRRALLPALSLALTQVAVFSKILRGDMMATLDQDFVAFADSKGLSIPRILFGHAFRPSSFSLLTLAGTQIGFLIGGTVIIETMFNLPGMGTLMVNGILQRDLVTVQGVTLFVTATFVAINFVVDVLYAVVDPRIRRGVGAAAI